MIEIDLTDLEITDEGLREVQAAWERRALRLKHPYVFDLIRVLALYPRLSRSIALDKMWCTRKDAGLPIPAAFDSSVQAALQFYCRDSEIFRRRHAPETEALYCWPEGKGAGVWALIHDNARVWLRANRGSLSKRLLGS
jgi:hypothetical protein